MEQDTKNKHRISDARWRNSVSRCYDLLKHCSYAEQDSTRMSILRLTLDQIQGCERQIDESGILAQVKAVFDISETLAAQQQQQQQQQHNMESE